MTFNLGTVQKLLRHYQVLQGHGDRAITCEIVPGLKHEGEDAWATVAHDADPASPLHVRVRDLARTPIAGVADPWTELKITMSHELWHPDVTEALAARTVEAEEELVEKFARAIVRAEAQGAPDARIMARSIQMALEHAPATLRARMVTRARDYDRAQDGKFGHGSGSGGGTGGGGGAGSGGGGGGSASPAAPKGGGAATGIFGGGADRIDKITGPGHDKATWAGIKAKELGKPVYVTPSAENGSAGFKLATKIGVRDSKGPHSMVHPDGSITHHNGGASHGGAKMRAATRARGGTTTMDEAQVKAAFETLQAGDGTKALEVLAALLASLAIKGAGGDGGGGDMPATDAAPVDDLGPPMTDMRPADMPPGDDKTKDPNAPEAARRARAAMEESKTLRARQVAAVNESEASAAILRGATIRARIHEARTVDKVAINPEAEKLILAAPTIADAEIRLTLARGSAQTTTQRARATHANGEQLEVAAVVDAEAVNLEGLSAQDLQLYHSLPPAARRDYAKQAQAIRARTVAASQPRTGDAS